ncbi:Transcriptional regulator, TetR family [Actinomycetales bacterium JB111]|nr:Transcriptional regulator, TetR family [Actinomycetales bacterium JB111]
MATTRDRAITASVDLLASGGIRALTHLRVDKAAGLPRGSTSNVFRTRGALLRGVCEHMVAGERPEIDTGFAAATPEELTESLIALYRFMTGPSRSRTAARLALIVEGGHDEAVRAALATGRVGVERAILPPLVTLGAPDPLLAVQLIATCFEGLFLHEIGRHGSVDADAVIAATVRTIFSPARLTEAST